MCVLAFLVLQCLHRCILLLFVLVLACWKSFGGPELGWVIVCLSAGRVLVGAGWLGYLWLVGF